MAKTRTMSGLSLPRGNSPLLFAVLIALSLAAFALLSYSAALTKSSTQDEPMHAVAGAVHRQQNDFRMDIDNPPLWLYWAEIPNWGHPLTLDLAAPSWTEMTHDVRNEWRFASDTLYHTPGTDGELFIRRCRPMQIILGVALGCILAAFTWQIAGALAGLIAVILYAFDPTFLAHTAQVKNDVPITLVTIALVWTLWHIGRRATVWTIVAAVLLSALTLTVKFSGILLIPIAFLLLVIRACMPFDWPVPGRILAERKSRLAFSFLLTVMLAIVAYTGVWAGYGFRFRASSDGKPIDTQNMLLGASWSRTKLDTPTSSHEQITEEASKHVTDDWTTRLTTIALQHEILPEAWLNGLLLTNELAKVRPAYLCGQYSKTGWWYYFPLAVSFKTPMATLLAGGTLLIGLAVSPTLRKRKTRDFLASSGGWTVVVLVVPFVIYALFALMGHMNIGVRHVLPLYPFVFMAIALGFSRLVERKPRLGSALGVGLFVMLVLETIFAWPNYIAFFNVACGGVRGGFSLLADSNLDWGQDLPLLAKWQRDHPNEKLYLAYDKLVDPAAYGIRYAPLPEHSQYASPADVPEGVPCIAVSATVLQHVYSTTSIWDELLKIEPTAVLGGSIYIWQGKGAALNWLGDVLMHTDRFPAAVAVLERAVQLQPNDSRSHNDLGTALIGVGQIPQATEHFRQALKLNPDYDEAHYKLGLLLASTGATGEAVAELQRAVELRPDRASSHIKLADLLLQTGEPKKAVEHYQSALQLQHDSAHAYANLAKALAMLNRAPEAIAAAEQGIKVARSSGQEPIATEIEEWLTHYRIELHRDSATNAQPISAPSTRP